VIHPFVQGNGQYDTVTCFTVDAELVRRHAPSIDLHAATHPLHRFRGRKSRRENVIFLFEPEFGMHHAIGELAVVREQ